MLDALKQKLTKKLEVVVDTPSLSNTIETQLGEQLQEVLSQLEQKESVIVELTSKLEALSQYAAAAEAASEALKVEAANKVLNERKEQLANIMGADNPKLDEEFNLIKSLDQAVFDLVIKSKQEAVEALDKSEMFNEIGVSGEAELIDDSKTLNITKFLKKAKKA